jgi:flagellar biogenesis protein FliO
MGNYQTQSMKDAAAVRAKWTELQHLQNITTILTKSEVIDILNTVLAVLSLVLVVGSMGYNIYHLTHLDEQNKTVEDKLLMVNRNVQNTAQVAAEQQKMLQTVQKNQQQLALSMRAPY